MTPAYPCHSKNTERFVQVHESAVAVTGELRLGQISSKLESLEKYNKLELRQNMQNKIILIFDEIQCFYMYWYFIEKLCIK